MKVKLDEKGKTMIEMFEFSKEKAEKLLNVVVDMLNNEVEMPVAIVDIYKKAKNSKELGFMLIYYISLSHAINFDEFMENIMAKTMEEDKSVDNMYR